MQRFKSLTTTLLLLSLLFNLGLAQRPPGAGQGNRPATSVSGRVLEQGTNTPIQYANIMLHTSGSGESITGTISDDMGYFNISAIRPGKYYVTVKFMGFEELRLDSLTITFATPTAELGEVFIKPATVEGQSVVVERERTTMEYKIDKKVINVGQDIASSTGTAVDVLENVPSVSVDIDGNVELRGSGNFTVLIDNRPSILEGNEALQTIPASSIDNIEIITNPSAAYDPDGVTGIINIITKKSKLEGISGIANLNAGMLGQLGGDILLNYRNDNYTVFLSVASNSRVFEGNSTSESRTTVMDTVFTVNQEGTRRFERGGYRIRTGFDYNLTDHDVIGVKLSTGDRGFDMSHDSKFESFNTNSPTPYLSRTEASSERGGTYYDLKGNYEHRFSSPTHRLEADFSYSERESDEVSISEQFDADGVQVSGRKTIEDGPTSQSRLELKYEQPFSEEGKFEAGYQIRTGVSTDINGLEDWDSISDAYIVTPSTDFDTEYQRNIQSLYSVLGNSFGKFGVQGGLRAEYTFRNIAVIDSNEIENEFEIDRWDYFPTVHLSYNITPLKKFMTSYTRRIQRPRGWYLEPFVTWTDAYNVRSGNPDLQPEYINAIEVGYMQYFGKNMLSLELYSRQTENLIERVQSVYGENVILNTWDNVGNSLSLGSEISFRYLATKWWDFNLMGNVYHYEINDQPSTLNQNISSDNWSLRFNNNFTLSKKVRLQLNAMYNSPSVSAQGERDAMFYVTAGARLTLIENKLSATINVRDLLDTGDHSSTSEGLNFYRSQTWDGVAPIVSASIKYNFNSYKSKDRSQNGDAMNGGGESAEGDDF